MTMSKFFDIKTCTCSKVLVVWFMCGCLSIAYSANIGEMYFYTPAANGSQATVKMDSYPETASGEFTLIGDGTFQTFITNSPTGLGNCWIEPLQKGYLQVARRTNTDVNDSLGLRSTTNGTPERASHYFGSGYFHAGTISMAVQPNYDWDNNERNCLFSSGSKSWVDIVLQNDNGNLSFTCIRRGDVERTIVAQSVVSAIDWSTDKWYFISASWKVGSEPILYVREMNEDKGPSESPDYVTGIVDNSGTNSTGTVLYTNAIPSGTRSQPFYMPLAIGALQYAPGGPYGNTYGMGAKMSYYRLDDAYMSFEEIDEVFMDLYNPPAGTCIVIQ